MIRMKHRLPLLFTALIFSMTLLFGMTSVKAAESFLDPEYFEFTAEEETSYQKPRGSVVRAGELSFKLYDNGTAIRNEDGLYVENGYLTLQAANPMTDAKGFRLEVMYRSDAEAAENDGVLLMLSTKSYGTTQAYSDVNTALAVLANGGIYVKGKSVSPVSKETVGFTAGSANVSAGTDCTLKLTYLFGKLTISFANGSTERVIVENYECDLSGLRQFVLGSDKNTKSRLHNITYRKIFFTEFGTYVPYNTETLQAVVQAGTECFEYIDVSGAWEEARRKAAQKYDTRIELYTDWKISSPITVSESIEITLDLRGHIIDRGCHGTPADNGNVFNVEKNATLHIEDSCPETVHEGLGVKGGIIKGGAGDDIGGGIVLKEGSTLTMNGGSIIACVTNYEGGAIQAAGDSLKVRLENAGFYTNMTVNSTDNSHGGAIYMGGDLSKLEIENCIFEGNYSEDNGGAIYMNDGHLRLKDTAFYDNSCLDDGGAIYYESGSNSNMENCLFLSNRANGNGGAVYCNTGEDTKISGEFRSNYAKSAGGALYVNGGTLGIVDTEITGNTAEKGGGVYVDEMYDLNVQGLVVIRENKNTKSEKDNVYLDSLATVEAHIYSGGLYEGSEIGVRTPGKNHDVCEYISSYQAHYLKSDTGNTLVFRMDADETKSEHLISSVIGEGRKGIFVIAGIMILGALVTGAVILKKRKKGGKEA